MSADGAGDENSPPEDLLPPSEALTTSARRDPAIRQKRIFEDTPSSINSDDLIDEVDVDNVEDAENVGEEVDAASPAAPMPDDDVDEEEAAAAGDLLSRRFGSGDLGEGYRSVAHKKLYYSYLKRSAAPDDEDDDEEDDDEEEDNEASRSEADSCAVGAAAGATSAHSSRSCGQANKPTKASGRASRGKRIFEGEEDDEEEDEDEDQRSDAVRRAESATCDSATASSLTATTRRVSRRGKRIFECDGDDDYHSRRIVQPGSLSSLAAAAAMSAAAAAASESCGQVSAAASVGTKLERRKRKKRSRRKRRQAKRARQSDLAGASSGEAIANCDGRQSGVFKRPRGRCKAMYESSSESDDESGSYDDDDDEDEEDDESSGVGEESSSDESGLATKAIPLKCVRRQPVQESSVSSTAASASTATVDLAAVSPLGGLNLAAALIDPQRQSTAAGSGGGGLQRQSSMDDIFESVRGLEASGLSVEAMFAAQKSVQSQSASVLPQSSDVTESVGVAASSGDSAVVSAAPAASAADMPFDFDDGPDGGVDADDLPLPSLLQSMDVAVDDVVGADQAEAPDAVSSVAPALPFPPLALPLYIDGGDKDA